MAFEKNSWLGFRVAIPMFELQLSPSRVSLTRDQLTHRQQHAFYFANSSEAAEERQETDEGWSDDQDVYRSWEQVSAQQLAQEVSIHECNNSDHKDNCTADLWMFAGVRTSFLFSKSRVAGSTELCLPSGSTYENHGIADEHSILYKLAAEIHSSTDTHDDDCELKNNDFSI